MKRLVLSFRSALTTVLTVINHLANLVVHFLQNNRDGHVATIHDFHLEKQALGHGWHPKQGTLVFQGVDASCTIELPVVS